MAYSRQVMKTRSLLRPVRVRATFRSGPLKSISQQRPGRTRAQVVEEVKQELAEPLEMAEPGVEDATVVEVLVGKRVADRFELLPDGTWLHIDFPARISEVLPGPSMQGELVA